MHAPTLEDTLHDIVICGGGMAGLTLALQIRQTLPELDVAVVEPTVRPLPPATHKVGESSVELGSIYLRRLGLRDYLKDEHIIKLALRFFPGGGTLPINERDELGPGRQPLMISYQMDRGKLETDLRAMVVDAGATLYEGARVTAVERRAGGAPHTVRVARDEATADLTARWVVDATGRRALFRKLDRSTRPAPHTASAGWFRVPSRLDVTDVADPTAHEWFERPTADERWRSTIHLMGEGYWVWIIPLPGGRTSVGIVAHEPHHGFDRVRSFERCLDFLDEHEPHFARFLRARLDGAPLDFKCLKRYSHNIDRWISTDRWAVTGEAGAFQDPLYSPGADSIALANSAIVEAIRADVTDLDFATRVDELQEQLDASLTHSFEFFEQTGSVYRHARAMTAKYYWDNFVYWSSLCQFFAQGIYRLTGAELAAFRPIRDRFFQLNTWAQTMLRAWAEVDTHRPGGRFVPIPRFPSVLIESNLAILNEMNPEDTLDYLTLRLDQTETMLRDLALRILTEIGPEAGERFITQSGLRDWDITFPARRLAAEALDPAARHERIGLIGRDIEACLYPYPRHPRAADAVRLLDDVIREAA